MSAPAPGPAVFLGVAMLCFGAFNAYIGYSMWGDRGKANRSRLGEIINGPSLIGGSSSSSSRAAAAAAAAAHQHKVSKESESMLDL